MNFADDNVFTETLKRDVSDLPLLGPGPALADIRRRGRVRRRRRRTGLAVGAVAALLSGTYAVNSLPGGERREPDSLIAARSDETRGSAEAAAAFRAAFANAGVPLPGADAPEVSLTPDSLVPQGWFIRRPDDSAAPRMNLELYVYPDGIDADLSPCAAQSEQVRSCRQETSADGVRLLVGESAVSGLDEQSRRVTRWSPSALAIYPDGRQVVATVDLIQRDYPRGQAPSRPSEAGYTGDFDLDILSSLVLSPRLASVDRPEHGATP